MTGKSLREFRREHNWTQEKMAAMLGVTQAAIARYERRQRPIAPTIARLIWLMQDRKNIEAIERFIETSLDT